MSQVPSHKIEAHKINKPIQLMAVWFITLGMIDSAFLYAASKITQPAWISPTLAISAIAFVPIFLISVFLMQTVFRTELQEDRYYSEWLIRQEQAFKDFSAENLIPSINIENSAGTVSDNSNLETHRIGIYQKQKGLFLIHSWRPSLMSGQVADVMIWLHQHGDGPLNRGEVERVEYQLGPKFFSKPKIKNNTEEQFRLEVSAYSSMLCVAKVFIKGQQEAIILERYINFEDLPIK